MGFSTATLAPMSNRLLLRKQIAEAWRLSMTTDYAAQRINSERSLQASVWSHLNTLLSPKTRRMFIEPCMSVLGSDPTVRFPDIVICNTRSVIGIVELKYQPRKSPSWRKDINTFHWLAKNQSSIAISNGRYRGEDRDANIYPLADNVLYVWAGVHSESPIQLADYLEPALRPMFFALHAETQHSKAPRLRQSYNGR